MKRLSPLLALALLLACGQAQAKDFSVVLTSTPVQVVPAATRKFLRIINVATAGSVSAWCSRSPTLTTTLAPSLPGSYELQAGGGGETFAVPGYVPNEAIWCVAASGTVALTAEAAQ